MPDRLGLGAPSVAWFFTTEVKQTGIENRSEVTGNLLRILPVTMLLAPVVPPPLLLIITDNHGDFQLHPQGQTHSNSARNKTWNIF